MDTLDKLITCISKLPGIGRKSAERIAMKLLRDPSGLMSNLAEVMTEAGQKLRCCSLCGSITSVEDDPCRLCTSPGRDSSLLCVVEDSSDINAIEKSGGFHGRYHALMGKISPMKGDGPGDLRIKALLKRVKDEKVEEVILALGTDMEGDSTAAFISDLLKDRNVKVTRLAFGLPAGSGIMYSDPVTLSKAITGRQNA
jgi:recombination protein RecR